MTANSFTFRLVHHEARQRALQCVQNAPNGYIVKVSEPTRSADQNAKMWATLTELSDANCEGRNWTPEQ